jgi:drug/metabolite transporter (DMT)-like permease
LATEFFASLLGILFAVALLGEALSLPQNVGIALVLGSIVAMERSRQPTQDAG